MSIPVPSPLPAPAAPGDAATYRSGVAARLAGVPVETLRVWERRYGVVGPMLSRSGQRLYSATQIERLVLIKQLVDMGHPIGAIATLDRNVLDAMRASVRALSAGTVRSAQSAAQPLRLALVGQSLPARFEPALAACGGMLQVVGSCAGPAEAAEAWREIRADVAIIELPTLNERSEVTVARIRDTCQAHKTIVLYRFAPSAVIRRLRVAGHEVTRASADTMQIEELCRALILPASTTLPPPATLSPAAPPRFDEHALTVLASASTTVYCECPRHLVELVLSLGSFERYSAECANRGPDDALLHRELEQAAARAREIIEGALLKVALAEGLPVPPAVVARTAGAANTGEAAGAAGAT